MNHMATIKIFTDYKSPYAYLATHLAYELERDFGVVLDWRPYTLDIPSYLGSAKVDARGSVLEASRNAHQWRGVKYSYMDCRREANRLGLTIRDHKRYSIPRSPISACSMPSSTGSCAPIMTACSSGSGSAISTSKTPPS